MGYVRDPPHNSYVGGMASCVADGSLADGSQGHERTKS
jgi:hypothetical protein